MFFFLSWLLFLLFLFFTFFQAVHHMLHRSWVRNEHVLHFPVGCFIFACMCIIYKKELSLIYLFRNIILLFFLFFVVLLSLPAELFLVPLLVAVCAFLSIIIFDVTLFNDKSIFFSVCKVLVFFSLCITSTHVYTFITVVVRSLDLTYVQCLLWLFSSILFGSHINSIILGRYCIPNSFDSQHINIFI